MRPPLWLTRTHWEGTEALFKNPTGRARMRGLLIAATAAAVVGVVPAMTAHEATASSASGIAAAARTDATTASPSSVYPRADGITLEEAVKAATDNPLTASTGCVKHHEAGTADCGAIAVPLKATSATPSAAATSLAEQASPGSPNPLNPTDSIYSTYGAYFTAPVMRPMYGIPDDVVSNATVAIITVGSDPLLSARLNHFRATWDLAHDATGDTSCTKANGCLNEIPGYGTLLPAEDTDWTTETNIDTQAVATICPTCNILVVDAMGSYTEDIAEAVNTAVASGAKYVSMSLGSPETPNYDQVFSAHPDVTFVASSGDEGYGPMWPANVPNVIAVGGTHTTVLNGVVTNQAWRDSGTGCSESYVANPEASANPATVAACLGEDASADISALADQTTGMIGYLGNGTDTSLSAWGGTSLAAPLVAAMYALAGNHTDPDVIYANAAEAPSLFDDVTSVDDGTHSIDVYSGSFSAGNLAYAGECGALVCQVGPGWDGATGLGVPSGLAALMTPGSVLATDDPSQSPSGSPVTDPSQSITGTPTPGTDVLDSTTPDPTQSPTGSPTQDVTDGPTGSPTASPSDGTSSDPTPSTSSDPSGSPSVTATESTTPTNSASPTSGPTTSAPTVSSSPSSTPTTNAPVPSGSPTATPTNDGGGQGGSGGSGGGSSDSGGGGGSGGDAGAGGGGTQQSTDPSLSPSTSPSATAGADEHGSTGGATNGGGGLKGANPGGNGGSKAAGTPQIKALTGATISGATKTGMQVHADIPSFNAPVTKVTVTWFVNGKKVKGHGQNLKIKKAWKGKKITYTVTASAPGYKPVTVHSKGLKVKRPHARKTGALRKH